MATAAAPGPSPAARQVSVPVPMEVDAAAQQLPGSLPGASGQPVPDARLGAPAAMDAAQPPRKKQRRHRVIARKHRMDALLDHPFFAAEAGFRRNKQARPARRLLLIITCITASY